MAVEQYPLLIFPAPEPAGRSPAGGGRDQIHRPQIARQRTRLGPQFRRLQAAFENQRMALQQMAPGAAPELVLVLETVGSVEEFARAVNRVPGMEWLAEDVVDDIPPDVDFFDEKHPDKPLDGKLFLILTDEQAKNQLISLWSRYQRDPSRQFERGLNKWRQVFERLRTVRFWDARDRISASAAEHWISRIDDGLETIRFELELWFYRSQQKNERAATEVAQLIQEARGQLVSSTLINEIQYHAFLADIPAQEMRRIIENRGGALIQSTHIHAFLPQSAIDTIHSDDATEVQIEEERPRVEGEPLVALLDGLPLTNHTLLAGRVIVDDPDLLEAQYPARDRIHGTAMASLILHGDLTAGEESLRRPLYVRPILQPDLTAVAQPRPERIPSSVLPVDLLHRVFRRIFDGEGNDPPVAPSVRVVSLSVCDRHRPFSRRPSAWARLMDWLIWKYRVLVVVAAGNAPAEIELGVPGNQLRGLAQQQLHDETIRAIYRDMGGRRVLSPAESVNALTVGAVHHDVSALRLHAFQINLVPDGFPSPINRLGLGVNRSVKPDVLCSGGRQVYLERRAPGSARLTPVMHNQAPGHLVATPSATAGILNARNWTRGTSNSAALASRIASQLYDRIEALKAGPRGESLRREFEAVVLKALMVHGASWLGLGQVLETALQVPGHYTSRKEAITRFLGYGLINPERASYCTDQRVTLLGCSFIGAEQGHVYHVPLPPSLAGKAVWRRLVVTLAWHTPFNPIHRAYRCANVWFETDQDELSVSRAEVDDRAARRGTLQHAVLEGRNATVFEDGDHLTVKVNCKEDASTLEVEVPYAICVTLEVAEEVNLPLYAEVRDRIRPAIRVGQARA